MGDFGGPTEDFGGRGGGGNHGGRGGGGRSASRRDHAVPHRVPLADDAVAERGGGTSRGDHPAVDVAEDAEGMPLPVSYDLGEAYQGENEDRESLAILLSDQKPPEPFDPTIATAQLDYTASGLVPCLSSEVTGDKASSEFYILETIDDAPTDNVATLLHTLAEEEDGLPETVDGNLSVRDTQMLGNEGGIVMVHHSIEAVEDITTEPTTENPVSLVPNIAQPDVALPDQDVKWTHILDREGGMVMMPLSMIVVEVESEQSGPGDLDALLHEGKWDRALQVLARMVFQGEAVNGAVEGAPGLDIYKAHPELVLWLRGQAYFDMWREGCTTASEAYHRDSIAALYPDGSSTGSIFADNNIMPSIRELRTTGSPLSGNDTFMDKGATTRKCVQDYLRVYFPAYRPQLRAKDSRVWEFWEKGGNTVRCLVCHKEYRGINLTKLEYHLMGQGEGKQGRCEAVTGHIMHRLEQILAAEEVAGTRRKVKGKRLADPPRHLPPPPPPPPPDAAPDAADPSLSSTT